MAVSQTDNNAYDATGNTVNVNLNPPVKQTLREKNWGVSRLNWQVVGPASAVSNTSAVGTATTNTPATPTKQDYSFMGGGSPIWVQDTTTNPVSATNPAPVTTDASPITSATPNTKIASSWPVGPSLDQTMPKPFAKDTNVATNQVGNLANETSQFGISSEIQNKRNQQQIANESQIANEKIKTDSISAAQTYATEATAAAQARIAQINAETAARTAEQSRQEQQAVNVMQPILDKEVTAQQATLAALQAKQTEAEKQAAIDADAANQWAAMSLNKLWLVMSTAGINLVQQTAVQGSLAIATLKANNAKAYADIDKDTMAIQIAHQTAVNKIINDSHDAILKTKETASKDIYSIQNNIILTQKEKNDQISKITADYINNKQSIQDKLIGSIRTSNDRIQKDLESVKQTLKDKQDVANKKINDAILSWVWDKLTPTQKQDYANASGKTIAEIEGNKLNAIYSVINASITKFAPGVPVSPESAKKVLDLSKSYMAMGQPPQVAIDNAIQAIGNSLPEYQKAEEKRIAENAKIKSEANQNNAQASSIGAKWKTVIDPYTGNVVSTDTEWNIRIQTQSDIMNNTKPTDIINNPQEIAAYSISKRGTTDLQCGQLVNDYWQKATGSRAGVGDSFESKVQAIKSAGEAKTPQSGGMFTFDPLKNGTGHIGIVQAVNADGSIEVLEANADNKKQGSPPKISTYSKSQVDKMVFSNPPATVAKPPVVWTPLSGKQWEDMLLASVPYDSTLKNVNSSEVNAAIKAFAREQWATLESASTKAKKYLMDSWITSPVDAYMADGKPIIDSIPEAQKADAIRKGIEDFSHYKKPLEEKIVDFKKALNISEDSFNNDYGSYYLSPVNDSKGNITWYDVMLSKFGSDESIGTIK